MSTALPSEKDLLRLVASGNEEAFTIIFNQYQSKVYSAALLITHSEIQAEEIVQDIFLNIWMKRESLLSVEKFGSWLFIVTRNHALLYLKKIAKQRELLHKIENNVAESDTEKMLEDKQYREIIQLAVSKLPEQQQQVYRLMREQGLSREETAQQLDIQPETVKTHMGRALKFIRAFCKAMIDLSVWLILFSVL